MPALKSKALIKMMDLSRTAISAQMAAFSVLKMQTKDIPAPDKQPGEMLKHPTAPQDIPDFCRGAVGLKAG